MKKNFLLIVFSSIFCINTFAQQTSISYNSEVMELLNKYTEGNGYDSTWRGSGVKQAIYFKGKQVLWASKHTYCTGFTFEIAMKVAQKHQLLQSKSFLEIRKFQKAWYCVAGTIGQETGCVGALLYLGIGKKVKWEEAQAGDFIQYWRQSKKPSGHSAIFKTWIYEDGKIVGLKYKSSQKSTNGIGDKTAYFDRKATNESAAIDVKRFYIGRLGN